MLKIRLQRTGRKHEPTFRVVLTDSQNGPKSGKFLEILGSYDARDRNETSLKADRITHWISEGAQVSGTVHNLLITKGIIKGEKINVLSKKNPIVDEEKLKAEAEAKAKAEEEKIQQENKDEGVADKSADETTPIENSTEVTESTEENAASENDTDVSTEEKEEVTTEEK